jgi:hypothetical protein
MFKFWKSDRLTIALVYFALVAPAKAEFDLWNLVVPHSEELATETRNVYEGAYARGELLLLESVHAWQMHEIEASNEALSEGVAEFEEARDSFAQIREEFRLDESLPQPVSMSRFMERATAILQRYDLEPPRTYEDVFQILSDTAESVRSELEDREFSGDVEDRQLLWDVSDAIVRTLATTNAVSTFATPVPGREG